MKNVKLQARTCLVTILCCHHTSSSHLSPSSSCMANCQASAPPAQHAAHPLSPVQSWPRRGWQVRSRWRQVGPGLTTWCGQTGIRAWTASIPHRDYFLVHFLLSSACCPSCLSSLWFLLLKYGLEKAGFPRSITLSPTFSCYLHQRSQAHTFETECHLKDNQLKKKKKD